MGSDVDGLRLERTGVCLGSHPAHQGTRARRRVLRVYITWETFRDTAEGAQGASSRNKPVHASSVGKLGPVVLEVL